MWILLTLLSVSLSALVLLLCALCVWQCRMNVRYALLKARQRKRLDFTIPLGYVTLVNTRYSKVPFVPRDSYLVAVE